MNDYGRAPSGREREAAGRCLPVPWDLDPSPSRHSQRVLAGRSGTSTREACLLLWYTVFFATTFGFVRSWLGGAAVFGFGSKNGAPVLATVTRMR